MKKETKKENTKKSFGAFEIIACISIVALMIVSVNCYIKKYEINIEICANTRKNTR